MPVFQQTIYLKQLIDEAIESKSHPYHLKVAVLHSLESQFGLFQLRNILNSARNDHLVAALRNFLKTRWHYLKNTDMQYCQDFESPLNHVCIKIAEILHNLSGGATLGYLMPSLKQVTADNYISSSYTEESLNMRFLVLNDEANRIIHIEDVLDFAILDGKLKHNSTFARAERELSLTESHRVLSRHETVDFFFSAISDKVHHQLHGETLGAYLQRLINGLTLGNVDHEGTEFNAAPQANIAIAEFAIFLDTLDKKTYRAFMNMSTLYESLSSTREETYSIHDCWERLIHKTLPDASVGTYCIKMIGHELENILEENPEMYQMTAFQDTGIISLDTLIERTEQAKNAMLEAFQNPIPRHLCYGAEHEQATIDFLAEKIAKNPQFMLDKQSICFFVETLYENLGQDNTYLIENCRKILTHVHQVYSSNLKRQSMEMMSAPVRDLFNQLSPRQTLSSGGSLFMPRKKLRVDNAIEVNQQAI
jgi:hypothetical protein